MSSRLGWDVPALDRPEAGGLRRRSPAATLIACAVALLAGVGVCTAAVLVPAPAAALAPVLAVSVGGPLIAGHAGATAIAAWWAERGMLSAQRRLRAALERLPEIEHPLDR